MASLGQSQAAALGNGGDERAPVPSPRAGAAPSADAPERRSAHPPPPQHTGGSGGGNDCGDYVATSVLRVRAARRPALPRHSTVSFTRALPHAALPRIACCSAFFCTLAPPALTAPAPPPPATRRPSS